ncbi:MAG: transporter substrate-binding domain-containing protein [Clostridia bacterium]|nr:transporter substrate-binding domain-containing protein [Clostridia bacterium]
MGWYDSPFNRIDPFGRRSDYAYEYQEKIAAYSGWSYEYVEGSWAELLQMLIDGEIDLMSDVSYTPDRAEQMLFPSMSMGAEEYYIFTAPDNTEIRQDDPRTLDGKKIGVNKGSVQAGFYRDWAGQRGDGHRRV